MAAIYALRKKQLTIAVRSHFVKGHQDRTSDPLSTWAQLTIQMDSLAKQHLQFATTAPRHYSVGGEPWQLWVKDYKLMMNIASNIYALMHDEEGASYWETKKEVREGAISLIDWKANGIAMRGAPRSRRVFVSKPV
jgi:hypothetical protein